MFFKNKSSLGVSGLMLAVVCTVLAACSSEPPETRMPVISKLSKHLNEGEAAIPLHERGVTRIEVGCYASRYDGAHVSLEFWDRFGKQLPRWNDACEGSGGVSMVITQDAKGAYVVHTSEGYSTAALDKAIEVVLSASKEKDKF